MKYLKQVAFSRTRHELFCARVSLCTSRRTTNEEGGEAGKVQSAGTGEQKFKGCVHCSHFGTDSCISSANLQTAKGGRAFTVVTQTDRPVLISSVERDDVEKKMLENKRKPGERGGQKGEGREEKKEERKGIVREEWRRGKSDSRRYRHGQFNATYSASALIDSLCATSCKFVYHLSAK